jgi:hypothetical protein
MAWESADSGNSHSTQEVANPSSSPSGNSFEVPLLMTGSAAPAVTTGGTTTWPNLQDPAAPARERPPGTALLPGLAPRPFLPTGHRNAPGSPDREFERNREPLTRRPTGSAEPGSRAEGLTSPPPEGNGRSARGGPTSGPVPLGGGMGSSRRSARKHRGEPYTEWEVDRGVPGVLKAAPEPEEHDPGPIFGLPR